MRNEKAKTLKNKIRTKKADNEMLTKFWKHNVNKQKYNVNKQK